MFDRKLIQITSIDSSFHIDFSTVKVLIHKLSSNTIKDRLKNGLEDVKQKDKDRYNTNNYLLTLRQLLNIARSHVSNSKSGCHGYWTQEVQINRNQFSNPPRKGGRGNTNSYNKGKGNYRKRSRSSDDDDDNTTYHINEFGDKVYKKKKPSYQKPRANNYATKVTEGSHKQSHYKNKETNHKQSTEKKR